MALTNSQQSWLQGFISFFRGSPRPTTLGSVRDGWDAAQRTVQDQGIGWSN